MSATESTNEPARSAEEHAPRVAILNYERRPVTFRITGQTVRIGPGGTAEIRGDYHALASELSGLISKGVIRILDSGKTEAKEPSQPAQADNATVGSLEAGHTETGQPSQPTQADTPRANPGRGGAAESEPVDAKAGSRT